MANSKYEYVKRFEQADTLLPNTWVVIRIDGRGFHKFSKKYDFEKPNDRRAVDLMNAAAVGVFKEVQDLILGYGISDEYSFVFHKSCNLFERRSSKLVTTVVSTFTSYYVHLWATYFPAQPLTSPLPSFDGRAVCYPSIGNLRDYMSWRQVDCHINNLYNTTFWNLIQKGGMDAVAAEERLKGSLASEKNEILFSQFGINYNNEPEIYRKGSVISRQLATPTQPESGLLTEFAILEKQLDEEGLPQPVSKTAAEKERKKKAKAEIVVEYVDIIKDDFWTQRPWILSGK